MEKLSINKDILAHIEKDIKNAENQLDDDSEGIITSERYVYIAEVIERCYQRKRRAKLSTSDKIDKVLTNKWLGLPIFAVIMYLVYYIAMVTIGLSATDWANEGLFGDGWHLFGDGSAAYEEQAEMYNNSMLALEAFNPELLEEEELDAEVVVNSMRAFTPEEKTATVDVEDEETLEITQMTVYYDSIPRCR